MKATAGGSHLTGTEQYWQTLLRHTVSAVIDPTHPISKKELQAQLYEGGRVLPFSRS